MSREMATIFKNKLKKEWNKGRIFPLSLIKSLLINNQELIQYTSLL